MTTLTLAQLRDRVAQRLRILGEGADLTGEDATIIENAIAAKHEELLAMGWAKWDTDAVPLQAVQALIAILAEELCGEYGLPGEERALLAQQRMHGEGRLQALAASEVKNEPTPAEYF